MLFRLSRVQIGDEGPWWAFPVIAAFLTVFAVVLGCARLVGPVAPLSIEVRKDAAAAGGFAIVGERVPEGGAIPRTLVGPVAGAQGEALEIVFAAPRARGQDLLVRLPQAGVLQAFLNGAPPARVRGSTVEFAGAAVKAKEENRLTIEPASATLEVAIRDHSALAERPTAVIVRGGPREPERRPGDLAIFIAAAASIVIVFAVMAVVPGRPLAAAGGLLLMATFALVLHNAVSGSRVFLSPAAAAAAGLVPFAVVVAGTLLRERPAIRTFAGVFGIYVLGMPFHGVTFASGTTPAPLPQWIAAAIGDELRGGGASAALETAAALLAAAVAAGGAVAVHRAAIRLVGTTAASEGREAAMAAEQAAKAGGGGAASANAALVLYAFGTSVLSTCTQDLTGHGLAAFGVALALYAFSRAGEAGGAWLDAVAGAALGLAAAARLPAGIALALAAGGLLLSRPRRLPLFLAAAAPFLAMIAFHDARQFGAAATTFYGPAAALPARLGIPAGEAVAGLLLAPSRGLLVYSPGLALALFGIVRLVKRADGATIALALFPVALVLVLAARGTGWAGGTASYGPRLLTEALPPLALLVAAGVDHVLPGRAKLLAWILVAGSILMHLPQFLFPNDEWNRRYAGDLEAAAWRAPVTQVKAHLDYATDGTRLR